MAFSLEQLQPDTLLDPPTLQKYKRTVQRGSVALEVGFSTFCLFWLYASFFATHTSLSLSLFRGSYKGLTQWLLFALACGVACGLFVALHFLLQSHPGAYLRQKLLRWYLWRSGFLPLKTRTFLENATDLLLLCKNGSDYQLPW
ncbi:hypothetical protein [Tengunoibacter tsumagoiensis]|uniref:Uncharacterized protein n=1 Tax=Tengunoibacter tsumagoiensis TaxID=2014871 RepID=A0A402A086_9CHLR|nr:hypothetical protein [Tengunoibacter tsumagoiensis]GCE12462.1 hypothetical protein KTT_23210 [Tengunoibacter tsumagoiensis]